MKKLHVVSNSHLDREHRHGFQETRYMLVEMMDELIEIMERDPEYKFFTLDGQAIVLYDYLEVKPEMKERLTKLIRDGCIIIGPWYSLVDCYSVNPEAVIRNLLIGDRACREFGEPMPVGYSIFSFGQMAQLPQIYAGFGIHDIVFYKGASAQVFPNSEFIWRAPDGSKAFTTRLGKEKRWNFFFDFDIPVILGGNAKKPGWQSKFSDSFRLCHLNDEEHSRRYATELQPDIRIRGEKIEQAVNTVMDLLSESKAEHVFLAFDGTDFTSPLPEIPKALTLANTMMDGKVELVQSHPAAYFQEVKEDIDLESLMEYEGEMRFGPINHVHAETMGTNTEIKQAAFKAENTIIHYAEPLSAFLMLNGGKYDKSMLDLAWRYLLAAHAHDSIHGSGDPKIKTDNLNRLEQVQEIADAIVKRAVEGICTRIALDGKEDISVVVFNTAPFERDEIVRLVIDIPQEELVEDYWLEDCHGHRVDTYQLSREKFNLAMVHRKSRPKSVYCDRFTVLANVRGIPAMGFTLLKVMRKKGDTATSTNPFPLGYFPYQPIGRSGNVMDNGLIRVTIEANGTVDVYDHETKQHTQGLNAFYDIGSSGDFWVHREPYRNSHICSKGGAAKIERIENSRLLATYRITVRMDIPEGLSECRTERSAHTIATDIVTEVTVRKDSKRVDFVTSLSNQSKDHLFVTSFPTGIQSEIADWESPFEIRQRFVDKFTDDNGKKGSELERQAMQHFVSVSDSQQRFSLFTKGIREAGTVNDNGAVITLTLFRAASGSFPIHNDLIIGFEKETSQCIGKQRFEYSILFDQDRGIGSVIKESKRYTIPVISAELGAGTGGNLKETTSFFRKQDDRTMISCIKRAEDDCSMIVRMYNPTAEVIMEHIEVAGRLIHAELINMNEEKIADVPVQRNGFTAELSAYKICTFRLQFQQ